MAETTLAVLGLAGLFKTTLEFWDFVDAGRGFARNFSFLRTRLDNQRGLFLIWAERMGFDSPAGYVKELDDKKIARPIENSLNHIKHLFSDTENLGEAYGVKVYKDRSVSNALGEVGLLFTTLSIAGDNHRQMAFQGRYAEFVYRVAQQHRKDSPGQTGERALRQQQKAASIWQVNKWAIRDEKKFETLITKIAALVKDLKDLTEYVPARKAIQDVAQEIVDAADEGHLPDLINMEQNSHDETATVLSSAASARLRSIEAKTVSSRTFVTAKTRQHKSPTENEKDDLPGTVPGALDFPNLVKQNVEACARLTAFIGNDVRSMNVHSPHRLMRELKIMAHEFGEPEPYVWYTVRPLYDDRIDMYLGTILGPRDTPYEGGVFHIRLNIDEGYPFKGPKVWFLTRVLHPNVDKHGAICMDILDKHNPVLRLQSMLIYVVSLLESPNWDEPVDDEYIAPFARDRTGFEDEAKRWTRLYATGYIINPGMFQAIFTTRQR